MPQVDLLRSFKDFSAKLQSRVGGIDDAHSLSDEEGQGEQSSPASSGRGDTTPASFLEDIGRGLFFAGSPPTNHLSSDREEVIEKIEPIFRHVSNSLHNASDNSSPPWSGDSDRQTLKEPQPSALRLPATDRTPHNRPSLDRSTLDPQFLGDRQIDLPITDGSVDRFASTDRSRLPDIRNEERRGGLTDRPRILPLKGSDTPFNLVDWIASVHTNDPNTAYLRALWPRWAPPTSQKPTGAALKSGSLSDLLADPSLLSNLSSTYASPLAHSMMHGNSSRSPETTSRSSDDRLKGEDEPSNTTTPGQHPTSCKPCAFFWSKGCLNGESCMFCHEWHAPKRKKPMKDQKNLMIISREDGRIAFLRCAIHEALVLN